MRPVLPILLTIGALALPAAANADATITNAFATPDWKLATVDDVAVNWSSCAANGATPCEWTAFAGVMAAAQGPCPQDWASPLVRAFWGSGAQSADGTVASGARTVTLNGAYGQRVCVWVWHMARTVVPGGTFDGITTPDQVIERRLSTLITSKLMELKPTTEVVAAPTPVVPPAVMPAAAPPSTIAAAPSCSVLRRSLATLKTRMRRALRAYRRHSSSSRRRAWQRASRAYGVARRRYVKAC